MITPSDYIRARDAIRPYDGRQSARLLLDVCFEIYLRPSLEGTDHAQDTVSSAITEFCKNYDGVNPPDRYLVFVFKKWAHKAKLATERHSPNHDNSQLLMDTIE